MELSSAVSDCVGSLYKPVCRAVLLDAVDWSIESVGELHLWAESTAELSSVT